VTDELLHPRFLRVVIDRTNRVAFKGYNYAEIDNIPDDIQDEYPDVDSLPEWVSKKLAVLSMIDPTDHPTPDIPGVGRRINRNVYWIYY